MKVLTTAIEGVVILERRRFSATRGVTSSRATRSAASTHRSVPCASCRTTNRTHATACCGASISRKGYSQSKLVRVVRGRVLDVAVDIRRGSPTFGRHVAVELTEDNKRQFFIPRGFAHGFAVLSDEATFQYKCDNPYAPESEGAIAWNDPSLGIDWRLAPEDVVLSPKDSAHPLLSEAGELFDYNTNYYSL